jgi:ribose 5-phosphate isomerase B
MTIYIGADHGGIQLKEYLKGVLKNEAYEVIDLGAATRVEGDDYVDYGAAVAEKVHLAPDTTRGILICRSGFGMDITANKFDRVRAALPTSSDHIYQGRHDDDVNVLCFAADFIDEATAEKIVKVFLSTPFAKEEKYSRRLEKIDQIEQGDK